MIQEDEVVGIFSKDGRGESKIRKEQIDSFVNVGIDCRLLLYRILKK
jgi:hypothetical protein